MYTELRLVDIIGFGGDDIYELAVPACRPTSAAFEKWQGFKIQQTIAGAVVIVDPKGTSLHKGDFLPLAGLPVRSIWKVADREE